MTDRIVIEGSLIRHERIETLSEAPLESLSTHLVRKIATTLPVLPSNPVRYIHFDGESNRGMMLVETAPALRHIRVWHNEDSNYADDAERRDPETGQAIWRVQFPWQYFRFGFSFRDRATSLVSFTLDDALLYWSRDTLRGENHQLIPAPVPNVDAQGRICWGSTRAENSSLDARIDDYINNFTTSTFNEDLGHATPFGTSLTEWERNSPPDQPLAWRDWLLWRDMPNATTPKQMSDNVARSELPAIAELNPSFVDLPQPPANFTLARAQEYVAGLTPGARRRLAAVLTQAEVPA